VFASDTNPLPTEGAPNEAALDVRVYPNPAAAATTVAVTLPEAADVHTAIYDVLGRRVATLHDGTLAAGTHPLRLDAARLSAGVYLVRSVTPTVTLARRFTVVR
ncbi:MAG: T9SS type A sorting domain-containing protein, partial [Bacteroidota bacterium]